MFFDCQGMKQLMAGGGVALIGMTLVPLLTIFGVKLVVAASTVLSVAIIVITALMVVFGLTADFSSISAKLTAEYGVELVPYTDSVGESIWRGILVYAAFQCVSIRDLGFRIILSPFSTRAIYELGMVESLVHRHLHV